MQNTIIVEKKGPVTTIWLNRPKARNAFNPEMINELINVLGTLTKEPELRILIIRGKNEQFCSGADIQWMKSSGQLSENENTTESQRISLLLRTLREFSTPTIALAEGGVFGGAIGIMVCCDWVLASEECIFGFPEVHLGIAPAVILPYVLMRIPAHKALHKTLTGSRFSSKEALSTGLVDIIVSQSNTEQSLDALIQELLIPSPNAQKEVKRLIRLIQQNPDAGVIMETINTLSKLKSSNNGQEGLSAFIEKRKPEWK